MNCNYIVIFLLKRKKKFTLKISDVFSKVQRKIKRNIMCKKVGEYPFPFFHAYMSLYDVLVVVLHFDFLLLS